MSDVTVVVKTKGADVAAKEIKDVGDAAEKSHGPLSKMGGAIGDVGKIAGGIMAAQGFTALGGAIRGAFADALDYQKMQAQTNAVIASTGGAAGMSAKEVVALANSLESVTAIDDQVIQGAENMLMTFTNIGKDVFPQATEAVLNMSTALGEDAQSAAMQLGKALNDPVAGVTALQRVGVKLTDSQKATIEQMVKMGDVAGAQKIILKELEVEFGNSARAAGQTLGGQLSLLKDTISDTFRDLAVKALPTLLSFAKIVAEVLPIAIDFTVTKIGEFVDAVSPLVIAIASVAWQAFTDAWGVVGPILATVAGLTWDGLVALGNIVWSALSDAWSVVGPILASAATLTWDSLVSLAGGAWDVMRDAWAVIQPILEKAAAYTWGALVDLANLSWSGMQTAWQTISDKMNNIPWGKVGGEVTDTNNWAAAWASVKDKLQPAIDAITPFVQGVLDQLRQAFDDIVKALAPLGPALRDLGEALKPLQPILEPLAQILGTILVVAVDALLLALRGLILFITGTIVGTIDALVLTIKGITTALDLVITAVTEWGPNFVSAVGKAATDAKDAIMGIDWWQVGADIIHWAKQGLEDMAWSIIDAVASIAGKIGEKLNPKNWRGSPEGIQNWYPYYFKIGMANLAAEAETNPDLERIREIMKKKLDLSTLFASGGGGGMASPNATPPSGVTPPGMIWQYIGGGQYGFRPYNDLSIDKYGSSYQGGAGSQNYDPSLPNYQPTGIKDMPGAYYDGSKWVVNLYLDGDKIASSVANNAALGY